MHESLDEFKFRPDTDTNTRVICPCASEKLLYNVVSTLAPSFLIGSSSYLQVKRTSICLGGTVRNDCETAHSERMHFTKTVSVSNLLSLALINLFMYQHTHTHTHTRTHARTHAVKLLSLFILIHVCH